MKKTAVLGMLTCAALMLSWVESLIGLTSPVPGIRIGLANLIVVFALYRLGWRDALLISLARVLLASVLFGSPYSLLYSLSGALVSFAAMVLAKRTAELSIVGVSVCGGVFHNIGQLAAAIAVVRTGWLVSWLPWLLAAGCVTGLVIGSAAGELNKRLPRGLVPATDAGDRPRAKGEKETKTETERDTCTRI